MNRCMAMCLILVLFALNAVAVDSQSTVAQNMYTGSVTLDGKGQAVVYLPKDFEALNTNPQYVLTAVGNAMPNLHVLQKIHDNCFWIAGGAPAGEVSWMVIAQRKEPAVANADASTR